MRDTLNAFILEDISGIINVFADFIAVKDRTADNGNNTFAFVRDPVNGLLTVFNKIAVVKEIHRRITAHTQLGENNNIGFFLFSP